MAGPTNPQAETNWRSDASVAYAILRLTLGVNICLRNVDVDENSLIAGYVTASTYIPGRWYSALCDSTNPGNSVCKDSQGY
jgi:hypothetical protein